MTPQQLFDTCEHYDAEDFPDIVGEGLRLLNLDKRDFASAFTCAISTIDRWKNSVNTPLPLVHHIQLVLLCPYEDEIDVGL